MHLPSPRTLTLTVGREKNSEKPFFFGAGMPETLQKGGKLAQSKKEKAQQMENPTEEEDEFGTPDFEKDEDTKDLDEDDDVVSLSSSGKTPVRPQAGSTLSHEDPQDDPILRLLPSSVREFEKQNSALNKSLVE